MNKQIMILLILLININCVSATYQSIIYPEIMYGSETCDGGILNVGYAANDFSNTYFIVYVYYTKYNSAEGCCFTPPPPTVPHNNLYIKYITGEEYYIGKGGGVGKHTSPVGKKMYWIHSGGTNVDCREYNIIHTINSTNVSRGTYNCIDWVKLHDINSQKNISIDSDGTYNFTCVNYRPYKLIFSDGHEYEFYMNDTNIVYNYDACSYITLNFIDSCENIIPETYGYYTLPCVSPPCMSYLFNSPTGSYQILFENQEYLKLYVNSFVGEMYYNITNPQDISYNILNEEISWNNNIWVCSNNTTSYPKLSGALIEFRQDCIIKEFLNPVRNKYSDASGYAYFYQCERDNFNLKVSKNGYKTFEGDFNSDYLTGLRDTQTIVVEMERDTDINDSDANYTDYNTYINFKNDDNEYVSSIYDTDPYFDIYYFNNNSEGENMELYFQKSLDGTWININNWNINHGDSGYKRIYQADFIDYHYSYRAILTNNEIVGWDRIKYLNVKNQTIYNETYDNLSTILWFRYKNIEDSIDYREDIKIVGYAKSDNATLLSISLELLDNNNLVEFINLTWVDFINAELKYYYEWNPAYTFIKDHNYTIKMYGYDYYLLRTDYVNAIDYRKNKLTIIVKDRSGNNLTNSYIFLEGYTSLSTGNTYYNSYDNLDNGIYRYKASKSKYTSGGWDSINITDSDNTVTYILSYDKESGSPIQTKMSDENLQTMFISLMVILLIFIMLGGLTHVSK